MIHTNDNWTAYLIGDKCVVACTRAKYLFDNYLQAKDFIDECHDQLRCSIYKG